MYSLELGIEVYGTFWANFITAEELIKVIHFVLRTDSRSTGICWDDSVLITHLCLHPRESLSLYKWILWTAFACNAYYL